LGAGIGAVLGRRLGAQIASLSAAALAQRLLVINVFPVSLANLAFFHKFVAATVARCPASLHLWFAVVLTLFFIVPRISRHFAPSH